MDEGYFVACEVVHPTHLSGITSGFKCFVEEQCGFHVEARQDKTRLVHALGAWIILAHTSGERGKSESPRENMVSTLNASIAMRVSATIGPGTSGPHNEPDINSVRRGQASSPQPKPAHGTLTHVRSARILVSMRVPTSFEDIPLNPSPAPGTIVHAQASPLPYQ